MEQFLFISIFILIILMNFRRNYMEVVMIILTIIFITETILCDAQFMVEVVCSFLLYNS